MNLSVGLIGLPNAGKSTLFNALVGAKQAKSGQHPFTTIKPNKGMAAVPDERLEQLFTLTKIRQKVAAQLTFVDIAGLIKGASLGEGLGNEFLSQIRPCHCLVHVLRQFDSSRISHPSGSIDPKRDLGVVRTELMLADLALVERHLADKTLDKEVRRFFQRCQNALEQEMPIATLNLTDKDLNILKLYPLLTAKAEILVLNLGENQLNHPRPEIDGQGVIPVCAKLEADLTELPWTEQRQYLKETGVKHTALEAIIADCYAKLDLITFYTLVGGKQVRAWPIPKNTSALQAAGLIHTDMQKRFVKAETIAFEDFVKAGSWHHAKQKGQIRLEGRDYQVQDGDILEIKFGR